MTTVLLVRHGQSDSNGSGTLTGQIDSPLTEIGYKQAEAVSNFIFDNYSVDAIYSSDLSRAVDTIKPLSELTGLKIFQDKRLREMDCGDWQGEYFKVLVGNELYLKWRDYDLSIKIPNGESFLDVKKRAYTALKEIADNNQNKTVVVTTHGGVVRMLTAQILNVPIEEWKEKLNYVANASTTVIEYENGKFNIVKTVDGYLDGIETVVPKGL